MKLANCESKYKNLNRIQSFSEQGYATVELFRQICRNDEYLKQKLDEVEYLDATVSYGFMQTTENEIIFDTDTNKSRTITFDDDTVVDRDKSTAVIEHYVDDTTGTIVDQVVLPNTPGTLDQSVKNWAEGQINTHWYVGFDKNETYTLRSDWIMDNKLEGIPSVCRAQTFTIPSGKGGKLEAVALHIANNGSNNGNWGSPLIVQLWKTKEITVPKMTWDPKTQTNTPVAGQTETKLLLGLMVTRIIVLLKLHLTQVLLNQVS